MYSKDELLKLYNLPLDELLKKSAKFVSDKIEFCSLINARNGKCSQDCKYCAQSSHYRTNIETYSLVSIDEVKNCALDAKKNKVSRFAIVTSGKTPDEARDFELELEMIKEINKIKGLNSCASLGILDDEHAKKLAQAGLKRYHHNINTSKTYYKEICSTHKWEDRFNTCKLVKKYDMELCCGVILGMGETVEDRIEMAFELAQINPDSIPINILMPIKQTPFENYHNKIDEENILRTVSIFKILMPKAIIRFCGGRMKLSVENQKLALKTSTEGLMVGNYLTTIGNKPQDDIKMIEEIDKTIISY